MSTNIPFTCKQCGSKTFKVAAEPKFLGMLMTLDFS